MKNSRSLTAFDWLAIALIFAGLIALNLWIGVW